MMCTRCREQFASIKAFDAHLGGTPARRKPCVPPDTVGQKLVHGQWSIESSANRLA